MNEFENKLIIREESYNGGFFPKIPEFNKRGSAFILTGGYGNDIVVDEHTTTREIRRGKYTKLVEISTASYLREIRFHSPSKESAYSFDVYVKAVIQVVNPILFYQNKNIDVDAYFNNLFSLDVRKITRKYSILEYDGMDEELKDRLSSYTTIDEPTGFEYQISVVDATPGEKAQEYVNRYSKQQVDAQLMEKAKKLIPSYSGNYEEAVMAEVVNGKCTEVEGIIKIQKYQNEKYIKDINNLEYIREKGFITDKQARNLAVCKLKNEGESKQDENLLEKDNKKNIDLNKFYIEEE